jgi:hypothetical protein
MSSPEAAQPDTAGKRSRLRRIKGSTKQRSTPYGGKFRAATIVLGGIAVAALAIAVAVVLANTGGTKVGGAGNAKTWSAWSPSSSGTKGVTEIAEQIAPFYRLSPSKQLDVVTPLSLSVPTSSGTITGNGPVPVVNTGTAKVEKLSLLPGHTVAFNICGIGNSNCALAGKPSSARLLLLRREALELALYTFKYISGTQNVIALLPPGHHETTNASAKKKTSKPLSVGVLFAKPELQQFLNTPLKKTLASIPPEVPQLPVWIPTSDAALVDQVTARSLFQSSVESQAGQKLLVMRSLPPQ